MIVPSWLTAANKSYSPCVEHAPRFAARTSTLKSFPPTIVMMSHGACGLTERNTWNPRCNRSEATWSSQTAPTVCGGIATAYRSEFRARVRATLVGKPSAINACLTLSLDTPRSRAMSAAGACGLRSLAARTMSTVFIDKLLLTFSRNVKGFRKINSRGRIKPSNGTKLTGAPHNERNESNDN